MILETPRLTLRPWRDDGVESFRELHQSPDVMAFLLGPNSVEETRALLTRVRDPWAHHGYGLFVLEKRETRRFLGFTGLIAIAWEARSAASKSVGGCAGTLGEGPRHGSGGRVACLSRSTRWASTPWWRSPSRRPCDRTE
jgi:hypothetical protein